MLEKLNSRAEQFPNLEVVQGDANHLSELLEGRDIQNPVVVCLQNSLGTWQGDRREAIEEMKRVAQSGKGELIISLFRQEALESQGIDMYRSLPRLVGEVDPHRTDFENGVFRGKKGYLSKWATPQERAKISEQIGGNKVNEILRPGFWIIHTSYQKEEAPSSESQPNTVKEPSGQNSESETEPLPKVVGSLGIAEKLLTTQGDVKPYSTWMGVSTNEKVYPDETVLRFARWASEHSNGFTLVVSNWLQRYNWVAERGDWDSLYEGEHIRSLNRSAQKRVDKLQKLFSKNGIDGNVVLWSDFLFGEIQSQDELFFGIASQTIDHDTQHNTEFNTDLEALAPKLVPHLRERALKKNNPIFVDNAMKWYAGQEIFFTEMMAWSGIANIKIGPEWERHYDEITAKHMQKGGYFDEGRFPEVPFGAVYLA